MWTVILSTWTFIQRRIGDVPQDLLPPEVARILATRGKVQLVGGAIGKHASVRCGIAPFEDLLFLFIRPGTNVESALLESNEAQVNAKDPDGTWHVRMGGRAVAGVPLMKHERRLEMLPWVPEEENPQGLIVVSFWPEELEYVRNHLSSDSLFYQLAFSLNFIQFLSSPLALA